MSLERRAPGPASILVKYAEHAAVSLLDHFEALLYLSAIMMGLPEKWIVLQNTIWTLKVFASYRVCVSRGNKHNARAKFTTCART